MTQSFLPFYGWIIISQIFWYKLNSIMSILETSGVSPVHSVTLPASCFGVWLSDWGCPYSSLPSPPTLWPPVEGGVRREKGKQQSSALISQEGLFRRLAAIQCQFLRYNFSTVYLGLGCIGCLCGLVSYSSNILEAFAMFVKIKLR